MGERFAILVRREEDGEWEFVPDTPMSHHSTPYKHLANARHQLEVLREKYPERQFVGATVVAQEGWGDEQR